MQAKTSMENSYESKDSAGDCIPSASQCGRQQNASICIDSGAPENWDGRIPTSDKVYTSFGDFLIRMSNFFCLYRLWHLSLGPWS